MIIRHKKRTYKPDRQYIGYKIRCTACNKLITVKRPTQTKYCPDCAKLSKAINNRVHAYNQRQRNKDCFYRAESERVLTDIVGRALCDYVCSECPYEDCILSED
jgi:predicted RNA-binding Zn-ribbon protein involved in translation (DUF1610 family)